MDCSAEKEVDVRPFAYAISLIEGKWKMHILFWLWKAEDVYKRQASVPRRRAVSHLLQQEETARRFRTGGGDGAEHLQKTAARPGSTRRGKFLRRLAPSASPRESSGVPAPPAGQSPLRLNPVSTL